LTACAGAHGRAGKEERLNRGVMHRPHYYFIYYTHFFFIYYTHFYSTEG
jgi:hypothetical protein